MADFLNAIVQFPTIIFTVLAGASLTFWIVTTLLGAGFDFLDGMLEADGELEIDADSEGGLAGFFAFFGLNALPFIVTLSLVSVVGWVISLTLMEILGSRTTWVLLSVGVIVFFAAAIGALYVTALFAKPLAKVFVSAPPPRRGDFVGRTCIVRTQHVDADFGQAEVTDIEGASLLVQVRCGEDNKITSGDEAIIWSLDNEAGIYQITQDEAFLT